MIKHNDMDIILTQNVRLMAILVAFAVFALDFGLLFSGLAHH